MDLQNAKTILNQAGFSPEALEVLNQILDNAITKGELSAEDKKRLLEVIDLETERVNLEADTLEKLSLALGSFVNDIDRAGDMSEKDLQTAESDFEVGMKTLEDQAQQVSPTSKTA